MVKLVLNISPVAKIGVLLVLLGVGFGAYGRMQAVEWAWSTSVILVAAGAIMYYASRFRSFREKRKL